MHAVHAQDTGGFFCSVLKKVGELPKDFKVPISYKPTGAVCNSG